jgi:hypothetical protein
MPDERRSLLSLHLPSEASANFRGRSSDLQAAYLLPASQFMAEPVLLSERSFLLTAAGQFRIFTGFPSSLRQ